ncbi:MAG: sigma-70 family RNA polymerase sigma factor [Gammaproteobacteria bacterium]|nr:sigma-70 family RNA polymerase sigma factor [Gammaproteobacteria bacterium]
MAVPADRNPERPIVKPRHQLDMIAAAQQGDQAAIRSLLAATQPDIRRYARMNCAADHVDDAVQDVLWLLYRRIGTLRTVTSFSAWLFQVVRRECQRLARRALGLKQPIEEIENDLAFGTGHWISGSPSTPPSAGPHRGEGPARCGRTSASGKTWCLSCATCWAIPRTARVSSSCAPSAHSPSGDTTTATCQVRGCSGTCSSPPSRLPN